MAHQKQDLDTFETQLYAKQVDVEAFYWDSLPLRIEPSEKNNPDIQTVRLLVEPQLGAMRYQKPSLVRRGLLSGVCSLQFGEEGLPQHEASFSARLPSKLHRWLGTCGLGKAFSEAGVRFDIESYSFEEKARYVSALRQAYTQVYGVARLSEVETSA